MKSKAVLSSLSNGYSWILKNIMFNENIIQDDGLVRKVELGSLKIKSKSLWDKEHQSSYQDLLK